MLKLKPVRLSELSEMVDRSHTLLSQHFKSFPDDKVLKLNNRIVGLSPECVEEYLLSRGKESLYRPAIVLSANLCGGVGKTTSIYNLGACMRRFTGRTTPIVYVDADSQGSFTSAIFGKPADDEDPILIDFLNKKASIDDILTEMGDNTWFVKSSLKQAWIDKVFSSPKEIKTRMLHFYESIFDKLGGNTKIFQDHTPQLSNLFASSVCALHQLPKTILKSVIVPIRSDKFAIQGADYILQEMQDVRETFGFEDNIKVHCFFSSMDRRISTTRDALELAENKENIKKNLSPIAIRYCAEIPKSIMSGNNVYSIGKNSNAAEDYRDLMLSVFDYQRGD